MSLTWSLKNTGAHVASPSYCSDFVRFLGRIYASCHYGVPYTTDDGATWTMTNYRAPGTNYYCYRLIVHNNRLFASGNYTSSAPIYYTDDGINWTTKLIGDPFRTNTRDFYAIGNRLFVCGALNGLLGQYWYTDDNGSSWTRVTGPMRQCYALAEHGNKLYICGGHEVNPYVKQVYYTTNVLSPTWIPAYTGIAAALWAFDIKLFYNTLYCCNTSGIVYRLVTPTSWTPVFSGLTNCRGLEVFDDRLYVCGDSATVGESSVYSTGNGTDWTEEGITSYHTDVYGIWGDTLTGNLWAGTYKSRAWLTSVYVVPSLPSKGLSAVLKTEKLGIEEHLDGSEITSITNLEIESNKNGQSISRT